MQGSKASQTTICLLHGILRGLGDKNQPLRHIDNEDRTDRFGAKDTVLSRVARINEYKGATDEAYSPCVPSCVPSARVNVDCIIPWNSSLPPVSTHISSVRIFKELFRKLLTNEIRRVRVHPVKVG